jgi:hypothetical protein
MKITKAHKGQTILPEYVVVFFVVIAALVTMSVFVQRAFQARARDAKLFMVDTAAQGCQQADAASTQAWPIACQNAAGIAQGNVAYEYEPYYGQINSDVVQEGQESKELSANSAFTKQMRHMTGVTSTSTQLPPGSAN